MNKMSFFLFITLLLSFSMNAQSQNIIGLWHIDKVSVGEQNMTPVAKWTRINADGTYQSGNGWLQNSQGIWNYDIEKRIYSAKDSLDVEDEFGGFLVSFQDKKMVWERQEEGMAVHVTLSAINELPMAPSDLLEGIWELTEYKENGQAQLMDVEESINHKLFIRWDRIYVKINSEGKRSTGYWHINGHKPEITFLPHTDEQQVQSWKIEVDERTLYMTGLSDSNDGVQLQYIRRNNF